MRWERACVNGIWSRTAVQVQGNCSCIRVCGNARLGVRVIPLVVVRGAAVLGSDREAVPSLGGGVVGDVEGEDTSGEGERERRRAPGRATTRLTESTIKGIRPTWLGASRFI